MARSTGRRTDTLHIRLEPELKAALNQRATAEDCSAGEVARRLLRIGLVTEGQLLAPGQGLTRERAVPRDA